MSGAGGNLLAWQWIGVPFAACIFWTILFAVPLRVFGLHLPEPVFAVWPAFAFDRDAGYSGRIPMGALLAIPAWVDIDRLGLSTKGKVIARAAQDYGVYVADRGGSGITFLAELGNTEIRWPATLTEPAWWTDIAIIKSSLMWVRNNRADNVGGGGTPRAPFAPPFADQ